MKTDPDEDRISELPFDIRVNIVSRLTIKEAASTCVLSSKWRYVWTHFTGKLDFVDPITMYDLKIILGSVSDSLSVERKKFLSWVNQALKAIESSTVEKLRISFDVGSSQCDVDKWVRFAMEKNVQVLELELESLDNKGPRNSFPSYLFDRRTFSSLGVLRLASVKVSGEVVECLLTKCPSLLVLSVAYSSCLESLKVSGPLLKLGELQIMDCCNLEVLEISAVNLTTFVYSGPKVKTLSLKTPSLKRVNLGVRFCDSVIYEVCRLSDYLSQLQTLKLCLDKSLQAQMLDLIVPELSSLEHMEIAVNLCDPQSHLACAALLKASPFLQRFTLKLPRESKFATNILNFAKDCSYQHLKVVEFVGFIGYGGDVELVMHFIENAPQLERIIIDPCDPNVLQTPEEFFFRESVHYQDAKELASQMAAGLPLWEFEIK